MRHLVSIVSTLMTIALEKRDAESLEQVAQVCGRLEFIARTLSQSIQANQQNRFHVGTAGLQLASAEMQKLAAEVFHR